MSEPTSTTMAAIHNAILSSVINHWYGQPNQLQTVSEYDPFDKNPVDSPAVLLSVDSMGNEGLDETGRTAIILDCNLTCILSIRTPSVQVEIRQFAAELMRVVEQDGLSRWGLGNCCGTSGNIAAQPALYNPEKSGFESFSVTWSQVFYFGGTAIPSEPIPGIIYASDSPELGIDYKPDYQQLTGFDEPA